MAKKKMVNSYFLESEKAAEILSYANDRLKIKGVSKKKVWEEIKADIDPDIPGYDQFCTFLKQVNEGKKKKALAVLAEMQDISGMGPDELLKTAISGTMVAGNTVIKQTLQEMEALLADGKPIPPSMKKQIMDWFFKGVDADSKRRLVNIKDKEGQLMETIVDNLMTAAQYGKLREGDKIVDAEFEETTKKELLAETKKVYGN